MAAAIFALLSINVMGFITAAIGDAVVAAMQVDGNKRGILGLVSGLVLAGTMGFISLDGQRPVDAFYCSCITLSTVGYGDICPATKSMEMKVFVAVLALSGLGVFCGPFLDMMAEWKAALQQQDGSQSFDTLTAMLLALLCVGHDRRRLRIFERLFRL